MNGPEGISGNESFEQEKVYQSLLEDYKSEIEDIKSPHRFHENKPEYVAPPLEKIKERSTTGHVGEVLAALDSYDLTQQEKDEILAKACLAEAYGIEQSIDNSYIGSLPLYTREALENMHKKNRRPS